jgi:hypothetical protein
MYSDIQMITLFFHFEHSPGTQWQAEVTGVLKNFTARATLENTEVTTGQFVIFEPNEASYLDYATSISFPVISN